jgi:hypothetical protein
MNEEDGVAGRSGGARLRKMGEDPSPANFYVAM